MRTVRVKSFELLFLVSIFIFSAMILLEWQPRNTKETKQQTSAVSLFDATRNGNTVEATTSAVNKNFSSGIITNIYPTSLNVCSEKPDSLLGRIVVDLVVTDASLNMLSEPARLKGNGSVSGSSTMVYPGGWWSPTQCKPRVKVAILIPFRNRQEQLRVFLSHMHPVFQRQLLSYRVFVVEQAGQTQFNKGAIYNIGFNHTTSYDDYDCYIFHDVDLLSENDKNYYGCPSSPRHMSVAIDKFKYRLPYRALFGGIQAFKKQDYLAINGYSNKYWGWGAEDDNLFKRIRAKGFSLTRSSEEVGRYKMNQRHHFRSDGANKENLKIYNQELKLDEDGLRNITSLNYTIKAEVKPLYTLISINLEKRT